MNTSQRPLTVVVACPGVGRVRRGYESFAEGLFAAMEGFPDTAVTLLQGARPARSARSRFRVLHLQSAARPARVLGKLLRVSPLTVERFTFAICSLPRLIRLRPDVVVSSERPICSIYGRLQGRFGLEFAVVLNNGGNHRPPFRYVDLVKHSSPVPRQWALDAGEDADGHVALEEGVELPVWNGPTRAEARRELGLPNDALIVLSVGLLDMDHFKRMGYVVAEVADVPGDVFLLLAGQRDPQTPQLEALLAARLPGRHRVCTVESARMHTYYRASDVLVSASQREGFGRAIVEAMVHGLPVIVHDDQVMRWVVGDKGLLIDTSRPGALAEALRDFARHPIPGDAPAAAARFGWAELAPRYRDALQTAVERRRRKGTGG